jgi:hypothetical protein
MPHYRRFSDASLSEKILDTMFLITIGIGYIFAMINLVVTHQYHDKKPGLSVDDIRIAYYGTHQETRLGAAINGPMANMLNNDAQKNTIIEWINSGAKQDQFDKTIAPILNENCIKCHSAGGFMRSIPLTSYDDVVKLTTTDTGASIQSLVRVSHIHLFGIAFLMFFLGRIFILCEMPVMVKRITVAIPFITVLVDISSWYLTKLSPNFAYLVVAAGALMGISIMAQIIISLYQMWFYKPKSVPVEM